MSLDIAYITPSSIPSLSANSVHIVMQSVGFLAHDVKLTIFANRTIECNSKLNEAIIDSYGFDLQNAKLKTFYRKNNKHINFGIALFALCDCMFVSKYNLILSRNLYFSFLYAVLLCRPLIFETHQVEIGLRGLLQKLIMTCSWVKTIIISKKLEEILTSDHGVSPSNPYVLRDAAPDGLKMSDKNSKQQCLFHATNIPRDKWKYICGYFGQLYDGRGIEVIEQMARKMPKILFLVYGGETRDVNRRRKINEGVSNIFFGGHISHPKAQKLMRYVDVLLMPYQKKVSIGVQGHDTGRWMSPMKMFEYMATGLPIISSDLPVLREVLRSEENAILVPPSDFKKWCDVLDRLVDDVDLANSIGKQAYNDYKEKYTWGARARKILDLVN